jgi:hypothetical protein
LRLVGTLSAKHEEFRSDRDARLQNFFFKHA